MYYKMAPFLGRDNIPKFLMERNIHGMGVEIGTHLGEYAEVILDGWDGNLVCVDPWKDLPEYDAQSKLLWGDKDRRKNQEEAFARLEKFSGRVSLFTGTSVQACGVMEHQGRTFDFVYLDGNHDYPYVLEDLHLWWNRLNSGGVLAGHDIICNPDFPEHDCGVSIQKAIQRFAYLNPTIESVFLVPEQSGSPWSYYLEKK